MSGTHAGPAHDGSSRTMGMYADEKSDGCMVPMKPRTMPSAIGGGDGGGTAAGRGESELQRRLQTLCWTKPVTDATSPRIGATWVPNPPKADHVRPMTSAGCGSAASPDLCGGAWSNSRPYRDRIPSFAPEQNFFCCPPGELTNSVLRRVRSFGEARSNQCVSDARHQRSCLPIPLQRDAHLAVSVLHHGCGIATAELEKTVGIVIAILRNGA